MNDKIIYNDQNYDIIIEDAGHFLKDQIICLFMCFKKLKSKGVYVVEDLNFPDTREDMRKNCSGPTLKEILNKIINNEEFDSLYINEDAEYFIKNSSIGDMSLEDLEREAIERTLKFFNNNRRASAKSLGMSERTLYRKIDEYGLERKIKSNG